MSHIPVGKIAEKAVCGSSALDNMALCFECRIIKNALPQTAFLVICPLGIYYRLKDNLILFES